MDRSLRFSSLAPVAGQVIFRSLYAFWTLNFSIFCFQNVVHVRNYDAKIKSVDSFGEEIRKIEIFGLNDKIYVSLLLLAVTSACDLAFGLLKGPSNNICIAALCQKLKASPTISQTMIHSKNREWFWIFLTPITPSNPSPKWRATFKLFLMLLVDYLIYVRN